MPYGPWKLPFCMSCGRCYDRDNKQVTRGPVQITERNNNMNAVTSLAELRAALEQAVGGEYIYCAPGNYGTLQLNANGVESWAKWDKTVTILASNPQNKPEFNELDIRNGVRNLQFNEIKWKYNSSAGAPNHIEKFKVQGSGNLKFEQCTFEGDLAHGVGAIEDDHGTGVGLSVVNGSWDVEIRKCEFFNWMHAIAIGRLMGVVIAECDIHSCRSDGIRFMQSKNVRIEHNYIHDFNRADGSGDHPDCIQSWTTNTTEPTQNIIIRNNKLLSNDGDSTQGIFMRNELAEEPGADDSLWYRSITIKDNIIENSQANGIYMGHARDVEISANALVANLKLGAEVPEIRIHEAVENLILDGNITSAWSAPTNGTWIIKDNVLIQGNDAQQENYYEQRYIDKDDGLAIVMAFGLIQKK